MVVAVKLKPLVIEQGVPFKKTFRWKAGGVPVDLTGCTARMHIRPEVESTTLYHELTTENGGIVLGGVDGTIVLNIPADKTTLFTWGKGVHDIKIFFPGGLVSRRLFRGPVEISPGVTR